MGHELIHIRRKRTIITWTFFCSYPLHKHIDLIRLLFGYWVSLWGVAADTETYLVNQRGITVSTPLPARSIEHSGQTNLTANQTKQALVEGGESFSTTFCAQILGPLPPGWCSVFLQSGRSTHPSFILKEEAGSRILCEGRTAAAGGDRATLSAANMKMGNGWGRHQPRDTNAYIYVRGSEICLQLSFSKLSNLLFSGLKQMLKGLSWSLSLLIGCLLICRQRRNLDVIWDLEISFK